MTSFDEIKALVCERCWNDVFNTDAYQQVCIGTNKDAKVTFNSTTKQFRKSFEAGCSLCSLLHALGPHLMYDTVISLSASDTSSSGDFLTPIGRNSLRFQYDYPYFSIRVPTYTTWNDKAARYVTPRPVQGDLSPDSTRKQIRTWLAQCNQHKNCQPQVDVQLPSRVIDIGLTDDLETPRIISSRGQLGTYACLSYVWGTERNYLLTESNLKSSMNGLNAGGIPQTIKDAMAVARTIPVRYLWVDALCILQDSEQEKTYEIAQMAHIYKNALVTIVAASSTGSSSGFLHYRPNLVPDHWPNLVPDYWPQGEHRIPFRIDESTYGSITCVIPSGMYEENREPINQRAWTLQEQLMAPRLLTYTSHTLQWRCATEIANMDDSIYYEHANMTTLNKLTKATSEGLEAAQRWRKVVAKYTSRELSVLNDKLPALAGIAKDFVDILGPRYYAGIWENYMVMQLAWDVIKPKPKVTDYRAPSWSWASVNGRVSYSSSGLLKDRFSEFDKPECVVVSAFTTPKSDDSPYGEVTNGELKLRARSRKGWLVQRLGRNRNRYDVFWITNENDSLQTTLEKYREEDRSLSALYNVYGDVDGEFPPTLVTCLPLFGDAGMILLPTNDGTYKRIGALLHFKRGEDKWVEFANEPEVEIVIV
jgi:hypothetical protein